MAVTIKAEINGQEISSATSYCYLYEPLMLNIKEDDKKSLNIFIDLEILKTDDARVQVDYLRKFCIYDTNPNISISVDLMKIAQQYHNSDVYKFSTLGDLLANGWKATVSEYIYNFKIWSDRDGDIKTVSKLPILGVRDFGKFKPLVNTSNKLTELEDSGTEIKSMFTGYKSIKTTLSAITSISSKPSIVEAPQADERCAVEGFIIWKSRLGGWGSWGYEMRTDRNDKSYSGSIDNGFFEVSSYGGGTPYVAANYTGINLSKNITLKSIGVKNKYLYGISGVSTSPCVYFCYPDGRLELMKVANASVPLDSKISGGDTSINLKSISNSYIKTR